MSESFQAPLSVPLNKACTKKFVLNLNQYRNTHYQSLNKAKIEYKKAMKVQLEDKSFTGQVRIFYKLYPKTKRLCDIGNVLSIHQKFFEDALVELGCIPEDNYTVIPETVYTFGDVDSENPRVEILVEEL